MTLTDLLHADGPHSDRPELNLFGQFIGSWDLEWSRPGDPDAPTGVHGELHFGWVLDGRAVQDIWIVPSDTSPEPQPFSFHGSTIRFFDSVLGAWRSTWIEPITGRVRRFVGRDVDGEIHLVSAEDHPFLRWRFTDISQDRFVWQGEYSTDEARTWQLEEVMVARRRA